jgi:hypothetical protein
LELHLEAPLQIDLKELPPAMATVSTQTAGKPPIFMSSIFEVFPLPMTIVCRLASLYFRPAGLSFGLSTRSGVLGPGKGLIMEIWGSLVALATMSVVLSGRRRIAGTLGVTGIPHP